MSRAYLSERVNSIAYSANAAASLKVKNLQSQGVNIIDLTIGEPGFDTPEYIKNAAFSALKEGHTKYIPAQGILKLRQAIASKLATENNLIYSADTICVANGAKQILYNAIASTVNEGDEVIIPAPCWSTLVQLVKYNQGIPVLVQTGVEQNYKLLSEQLESTITSKTKWLLLNTPNNPTGAIYSNDEWILLADVLRRHPHVFILIDEIYEHIIFTNQVLPNILHVAPDLKDRVLIVNGFSKTFAMTGWRVGYAAGPQAIINAMSIIQSQTTSGGSSVSQYAALAALTSTDANSFIEMAKAEYLHRRDILVEAISKTHLSVISPEGSFFVFPSWKKYLNWKTPAGKSLQSDQDFSDFLLEYAGVASIAGDAFDAPGHIRFSIGANTESIRIAAKRIVDACTILSRSNLNAA